MSTNEITPANTFAAIDLGSNSFHMAVAGATSTHLQMIDKLRRPVRLGSGLDKNHNINPQTINRALECLAIFQQRLRGVPKEQIRAVGTNTMRRARNSKEFNDAAEEILGIPIEIISGREEARLIYTGVTYGIRDQKQRLVIDIGGGSTEFIAGSGIRPNLMESVNIGCVSYSRRWFGSHDNMERRFENAVKQAQTEIQPLTRQYLKHGWEVCTGSSGTIKATEKILTSLGLIDAGIDKHSLEQLVTLFCKNGLRTIENIDSVSSDRHAVIPGGLAVLVACFRSLNIESMSVSHNALREGVIVDLSGEALNKHVRHNAVSEMQRRFQIDNDQAQRVTSTADYLFQRLKKPWKLNQKRDFPALRWATALHEIGLSVSHAQYHKHGDYLLRNADMLGFSRKDQNTLAALVRNHRRKICLQATGTMQAQEHKRYTYLLTILRLAVLFHRTRGSSEIPELNISAGEDQILIRLSTRWLDENPLTDTNLHDEIRLLTTIGINLHIERTSES